MSVNLPMAELRAEGNASAVFSRVPQPVFTINNSINVNGLVMVIIKPLSFVLRTFIFHLAVLPSFLRSKNNRNRSGSARICRLICLRIKRAAPHEIQFLKQIFAGALRPQRDLSGQVA